MYMKHHTSQVIDLVWPLSFTFSTFLQFEEFLENLKNMFKGTVSQTAHVQVINQKWSDVFKFVICETKRRQQAEDNPHSHGGRRNNSGRKQFSLIPAVAG